MDTRQALVLIDTNIFVIDLRYRRDAHFRYNRTFLKYVEKSRKGFTTIINLLELCGILSFNLNEKQLFELWHHFQERYKVTVLPSTDMKSSFPNIKISEIFDMLRERASLGDALMIAVAEKILPFVSTLVTWDKDHFTGKFGGIVLTPHEFLGDCS